MIASRRHDTRMIKTKFGVMLDDKLRPGMWSFGMCLSHSGPETYLYINLFKWTIVIGKFYDYRKADNDEFSKKM